MYQVLDWDGRVCTFCLICCVKLWLQNWTAAPETNKKYPWVFFSLTSVMQHNHLLTLLLWGWCPLIFPEIFSSSPAAKVEQIQAKVKLNSQSILLAGILCILWTTLFFLLYFPSDEKKIQLSPIRSITGMQQWVTLSTIRDLQVPQLLRFFEGDGAKEESWLPLLRSAPSGVPFTMRISAEIEGVDG